MSSHRREFARALRKQMTRAEDILWAQLRGSRFHGAKFRRQVPIDRYVADFYRHAAKLVIDPRTAIWTAIRGGGRQAARMVRRLRRLGLVRKPKLEQFSMGSEIPRVGERFGGKPGNGRYDHEAFCGSSRFIRRRFVASSG
jgi:Protein of unknown function (DUF559)